MRVIVLVAVLVGCGGAETKGSPATTPGITGDLRSQRTIAACRSRRLPEISRLGDALGPGCDRPAMGLALRVFDLAAYEGFHVADHLASAQLSVCNCVDIPCQQPQMNDAVARAKDAASEITAAADRGIAETMGQFSSHACVDAGVAGRIYSLGFTCGLQVGRNDSGRRSERAGHIARVFAVSQREAEGRELACVQPWPER